MVIRVGIDGRSLRFPLTGVGRYTWELTRRLAAMEGLEVEVFAPRLPRDPRQIRASEPPAEGQDPSLVDRIVWHAGSLVVPPERRALDVFWGPNHSLPKLSSRTAGIVTIHDLVWRHAPRTMRRFTRHLDRFRMSAAVRAADHIVAVSEHTARDIGSQFGIATSRISVISPGITVLPEPGPKALLSDLGITAPFVLCVGTQEPRKNHQRLIDAFQQVRDTSDPPPQLVIAGGQGWGPVDLQQEIGARGWQESVRVLGFVDDSLLSTLYAHCRFVAMPSLFEGFGMPLIEAFGHGKPVLAAGNSSMPEVVGDGGVLVDPLDTSAIADGLRALLDDQTRVGFAARASERAALYNWDHSAAALARTFARLVEERA